MNESSPQSLDLEENQSRPDGELNRPERAAVLVIGAGPGGLRVAQELAKAGERVVLLNGERYDPYNRVKLTPLLTGDVQVGQIIMPPQVNGPGLVERYDSTLAEAIDLEHRLVLSSSGRIFGYEKLVLALGSWAFLPGIPGITLSGVFAFRNAADVEALIARSFTSRHVVVIGGGLLGLEAARAMAARGAKVTVVEHEDRLMPRQLDRTAGQLLQATMAEYGIACRTGTRVDTIEGMGRVERVVLAGDEVMDCDTVIVCAGVRPHKDLALKAGLHVGRGIRVNERMQTSDSHVFAIGECAELNGSIPGLIGPVLEQADCVVSTLKGEAKEYSGSVPTTKLKVVGAHVFSMGEVETLAAQPGIRILTWTDGTGQGLYRKLFLDRGRLKGAIGMGEWPEAMRLQQVILEGKRIGLLSEHRFRKNGCLWPERAETGVAALPEGAIICNCTGVTKGRLESAVQWGARDLDDIRANTGANTVCGACAPAIEELLGKGPDQAQPVAFWKWLIGCSVVAAVLALVTLGAPRIPLSDSFGQSALFEMLWFDSFVKEITGYGLLAITTAAALLGLRKRIPFLRKLGSYDGWRLVHLLIGGAAGVGLFLHTGFRLGSNLNATLMVSFLIMLVLGAIAGFATGGDHELRRQGLGSNTEPPRKLPTWAHILAFWPVPVLLAAHILTVYSF
ncbi:MAG: FAD-dependent oxidoreductase [Magnetovibrionaceae bacterium]